MKNLNLGSSNSAKNIMSSKYLRQNQYLVNSDREHFDPIRYLALGGLMLAFLIIIVVVNPYINPYGWGYERGKELARESYAMARYENSRGNLLTGLYYSYLGLKTSIDSELDHMRARPFLDESERLSQEGKLSEARTACLKAEKILIQYIWDYGIHSNCAYEEQVRQP